MAFVKTFLFMLCQKHRYSDSMIALYALEILWQFALKARSLCTHSCVSSRLGRKHKLSPGVELCSSGLFKWSRLLSLAMQNLVFWGFCITMGWIKGHSSRCYTQTHTNIDMYSPTNLPPYYTRLGPLCLQNFLNSLTWIHQGAQIFWSTVFTHDINLPFQHTPNLFYWIEFWWWWHVRFKKPVKDELSTVTWCMVVL